MQAFLIIKPVALNEKKAGQVLKEIEEKNLAIIGIKAANFDLHKLEKKAMLEENKEVRRKINEAKKVPCILLALEGNDAFSRAKEVEEKFLGLVYVSLNQEISRYELKRFFDEKELFRREKTDSELFFGNKNWEKYSKKSVKEVALNAGGEKIN